MKGAAAHLRDLPRGVGRLAGTFNAMLERLHAAFAAQQRFVADASHELRTPLATIRGRSDVLLLCPTLDPETRDGLVMVRDEAERMGRLVANLLLLARGDEARAIDRRRVERDVLLALAMHQPRRQRQPLLPFAAYGRNQSGWRSAVLGINARDSGPGDAVVERSSFSAASAQARAHRRSGRAQGCARCSAWCSSQTSVQAHGVQGAPSSSLPCR
jgi:signal transduction histidine kinase